MLVERNCQRMLRGNPDLSHRLFLALRDFPEHRLQNGVDDRVQKLRMAELVAGSYFLEIIEPDSLAEFPGLHLFPPQLAGQADVNSPDNLHSIRTVLPSC